MMAGKRPAGPAPLSRPAPSPLIRRTVTFSIDFERFVPYNAIGVWSRHFVSHKVFLPHAPFAAAFIFWGMWVGSF